jgi:hypothetical protein
MDENSEEIVMAIEDPLPSYHVPMEEMAKSPNEKHDQETGS